MESRLEPSDYKNNIRKSLLLYAVTDRSWVGVQTLHEQVESALVGGVTLVQLREKNLDDESFLREAISIKQICDRYHVPLLINDNIEVAIRSNAAGVHIGQDDMDLSKARALLGQDKIIGVSVDSVEQALEAENHGADYVGVGAVFSTQTKEDADVVSRNVLIDICKTISIPAVAIGGIKKDNMSVLQNTGVAGVAVVSAIFGEPDVELAAQDLRDEAERLFC